MIRAIIVDDELLASIGIRSLIDGKEEISVSGVFNTPEEAVAFLRENIVDIVITDIEMSDMSGLDFIQIIREEDLAAGIIILSCHDEFSYAQEAISRGTDSYLLKHNVSSDMLIREIKKVYQKTQYHERLKTREDKKEKPINGTEIYTVCVLRICSSEILQSYDDRSIDTTMLTHLLERIVMHYEMGTLFAPYNQEMFIVFQDDNRKRAEEQQETIYSNVMIISRNISQYIDGQVIFGLSSSFKNLKQMKNKYDEAASAVEMSFYKPEKQIFMYHEPVLKTIFCPFTVNCFLNEDGLEIFEKELNTYLRNAELSHLEIRKMQGQLIREVNKMLDQILKEHLPGEDLIQKWSSNVTLISVITQEKDEKGLKENLIRVMREFREDCLREFQKDSLISVFTYIEDHLEERLSLTELAEIACMSVPTFSKKFKERTNMTLVQYLNERRIERAKKLMQNKNISLEEVAEKSGFSNANYLVRVFKKVTGVTVSNYRK